MGNLLPTSGHIKLIDPSCGYAERGLDLAMLTLFGNPPAEFWKVYEAVYPIPHEVRRDIPVYQLYYALAHVCLFGAGYIGLCQRLWRQFRSSWCRDAPSYGVSRCLLLAMDSCSDTYVMDI